MIKSNSQPVEVELVTQSSKLYIFFGGIAAGITMPPFEFYNSSRIFDESKIFIRDFSQCWYHDGLPGISSDIDSTANYLRDKIEKINPEKLFWVGNSMGGYAAILFSALIGRGEVIAFAPQTFISPLLRLKYGDFRWKKQVFTTYKKGVFKQRIWDLKELLSNIRSNAQENSKVSIFVSKSDRLDYAHALRMKEIPGTQIYSFEGGGHGIVKLLRDRGDLSTIMSGQYA